MEDNRFIVPLLDCFSASPSCTAFRLYDGRQVTEVSYGAFLEDILRCAGYFHMQGLCGIHIALAAPNSYHWVTAFLAILASGNCPVLLDAALPEEALLQQCRMTDVALVCGECGPVGNIPTLPLSALNGANPLARRQIPAMDGEDTAVLLFTSGTTGKSKAVMLSHRCLAAATFGDDLFFHIPDLYRTLLVLPLHHISGLRGVLTYLCRGKTVCIGRGPGYLLADLPVLSPSQLLLVPSVAESLVKVLRRTPPGERSRYLGTALRRVNLGGAETKPDVAQYLIELGLSVENGYGMTETCGVGTWGLWDPAHPNFIGSPCSPHTCRLHGGELQLSGPFLMKGYYKDPAATAEVMDDGWIRTGDLGIQGPDGGFYLTGRKKNIILLSNGECISPEDLESALYRCDAIRECVVYSDGKGIRADIYSEDPSAAAGFLRSYNESMPRYRQIYKVHYSPVPLEKSASGKLKRKEGPHAP